ncbi:UNVERIFIED_CONTAM: hypothetical protein FKN15_033894 [Acipenser sinensis]
MMDPFHVPLLASSLFLPALTTMTLAQNNTGSNSTSNNPGTNTDSNTKIVTPLLVLLLLLLICILSAVYFLRFRNQRKADVTTVDKKIPNGILEEQDLIKAQEDNAGELSTPCSQEQQTVMLLTRSPSASKKYFPIPVDCLEEEYRIHSADDGKLFREEFNSLPNGYTQGTCEEANREDNKEKNRYPNILPYDHSRVILMQIDDNPCSDYINASYIDQTSEGSKAPRLITQLHFTSWPDFGVPFTPIGMLKFLKKVKTVNPSFAGPIVVHCSAGVGRTGTFIVIDAMIDMMHAEQKVDVFALVSRIREQRSQLVQTDMQYSFIYQALLEYYLYGDTELDVSSLEGHLQKLHNTLAPFDRIGLEEEFKKLTNVRIMKENMRMGNLPANMKKNRVLQIIPYDFNRVILSMKRGQENTDYINASFIDGYRQKDYFIATQGPLSQTVEDFWRMVWEWKSHSIVMLTELQEREQDKCFQYWPSEGSVTHGDWTVEIKGDARCDTCSVRDFMLSFSPEKQTRLVRQFHFHGWPEIGIPADGKGMIDIIAAVQKQQQQSGNHPIIVHCRKPDCDIRIQLPHVSKEHCKIEVNENKEVIVTNLSTVNPTRLNGKIVHQSESLKDRDVITIIDRSFRFEYPPELTPKKRRLSASAKNETLQVLHFQQVKDTVCLSPGNQRQSTTLTSDASYDLKEAKAIGTELLSEAHIKNATPGKKDASDTEFAHNHRGNQEKLLEAKSVAKTPSPGRKSLSGAAKTPTLTSLTASSDRKSPNVADIEPPPGWKSPKSAVKTPSLAWSVAKTTSPGREFPASASKMPSSATTITKTPPPGRKSPARSAAKTPSPARSAARTPSPARSAASTPSPARSAARTPSPARSAARTPSPARSAARTPSPARSAARTPSPARSAAKTPSSNRKSLSRTTKTPSPSMSLAKTPSPGTKSLTGAAKTPSSSGAAKLSLPSRRSLAGAAEMPSPNKSVTKTPSTGRKSLGTSANTTPVVLTTTPKSGTPYVSGRFSVSHISTPSPIPEQSTVVSKAEPVAEEIHCDAVTPKPSHRRKSIQSAAKKTPSRRKSSVLDAVHSRSGASKANLLVARSWADIVKLGAAKTQRMVFAKKQATKAKKVTIKKVTSKMPKTPAQKIKGHFSTGHADSPMTIVVGRAHARAVKPAGQVPKLVRNLALLKRSMEMNESFTGIAEMFSIPVNEKPRRTPRRSSASTEVVCSTPVSLTDASVLNTPEETGEMVVSPLSAPSTARRGRYNKDAVTRLLQEKESSYSVVKTPAKEIIAPIDLSGGSQVRVQPSEKVLDTSEQTLVEKTAAETDEGCKKLMRTPKQKAESLVALTGVKRLMKTPKQKSKEIEDFRGLKRLMRTPKKPKVQIIEDLVGVKRIMTTPKQKASPVEDMVGIKRLMRTPKNKGESVEGMSGISRTMKSAKLKIAPIEGFAVLQELMEQPEEKKQDHESKLITETFEASETKVITILVKQIHLSQIRRLFGTTITLLSI